MRPARPSRSDGSTSSPIRGPISTRRRTNSKVRPDLSGLALETVVDLHGVLVDVRDAAEREIGPEAFAEVDGCRTRGPRRRGLGSSLGPDAYLSDNPFLTEAADRHLVAAGAALIGIDSPNVDSLATRGDRRTP